jgi:hypothetical protein
MKIAIFWGLSPCILVEVCSTFAAIYFLHLQGGTVSTERKQKAEFSYSEDRGAMIIQNVGAVLPDYPASHPKNNTLHEEYYLLGYNFLRLYPLSNVPQPEGEAVTGYEPPKHKNISVPPHA